MQYLNLQNVVLRYALSATIAILIAGLLTPYAYTQSYWILLAAFLVTQVTRGTPLRQGIIHYLMMLIAIYVAAIFPFTQFLVLALFLISSYLLFIYRPQALKKFTLHLLYLFAMVLLATQVYRANVNDTLQHRILDISIGTLIGILCGQFIFPIQYAPLFKKSMCEILKKLQNYAQAFNQQLFSGSPLSATLFVNYPAWLYEVGFNPGLRSGYRFFLINIERVQEILMSMNYTNRLVIKDELATELKPIAQSAMQKNIKLMEILEQYFTNKTVQITADYTSDIVELEKSLAKVVPSQLELLDISEEYVALTKFVYDVKALRKILLKLIMAFPNNVQRGD